MCGWLREKTQRKEQTPQNQGERANKGDWEGPAREIRGKLIKSSVMEARKESVW